CILTTVCSNQAAGAAIQIGGNAVFARFTREDEAEADAEGVRTTTRAGIDPRGIPEMFRILLNERKTRPSALESWFQTHPLEEDRIQATEALIAQINPSVLNSLTRDTRAFQSFKARVMSLPTTARSR